MKELIKSLTDRTLTFVQLVIVLSLTKRHVTYFLERLSRIIHGLDHNKNN